MRAIWVDAFGEGIRTPDEIDELVAFAGAAGLDALVVQVTRRGDTLANALDLPRAEGGLAPLPFDPLAATCERAHAAGLTVHAWLGATPIAMDRPPPAAVAPLLSRRVDGTDRDHHGITHLDPGHPEARTLIARWAATIAASYPVDGVNLDRIRYPDPRSRGAAEWGYNPEALVRFAEAAGGGMTGEHAPPSPHDEGWQAWRRDQVTALVDETVAAVRAARGDVTVSTTGCCFGGLDAGWEASRPWVELGQDWPGWLREERLDLVLVMNYRGDADDADLVDGRTDGVELDQEGAVAEVVAPDRLRGRFDDWAHLAIDAGGRRAVLGTGLYLHDAQTNADDVRHATTVEVAGQRAGGWCGFSYRNPSRLALRGERTPAEERAALARLLGAVRT